MTSRRNLIGAIVAAFAATITLHRALGSQVPSARRLTVEISGFAFAPKTLEVKAGDTVVWRNLDIVPHTATAMDGSWDTGLIEAGEEREVLVTEAMAAAYYCRFHPSMVASLAFSSN